MELFGIVGFLSVGFYAYGAIVSARASSRAGNSGGRMLVDALIWPIMVWMVIEELKNSNPDG